MLELEKQKMQGPCSVGKPPKEIGNLDLMFTLSIELQRVNTEMILQRQPTDEALEVRDLTRLESDQHSAILAARNGLDARKTRSAESCQINPDLAMSSKSPKLCYKSPKSIVEEQQ